MFDKSTYTGTTSVSPAVSATCMMLNFMQGNIWTKNNGVN